MQLPPQTGSLSVAATSSHQVGMASSTILSPRPLELAPAASLSELDQFCSGPLDSFLEEATRLIKIKRSGGNHPSKALHTSSHKKAASSSGKPPKAGGMKKAQVRERKGEHLPPDRPRLAARLQSVSSLPAQPSASNPGLLCVHQQQATQHVVLRLRMDGWCMGCNALGRAASHGCMQLPLCRAGCPMPVAPCPGLPSLQVAGRSLGSPNNSDNGARAKAAAALDPLHLAKLRAANEIVRQSWQYKVRTSFEIQCRVSVNTAQ